MSLTLEEIKDKLKKLDEVILLEILDISSEELVERFVDFIENKLDELEEDLEERSEEL